MIFRWTKSWEHWYRRLLPAYWVFLFLGTHLPKLRLPNAPPQSDKLIHFVAFGLLAFVYWRFAESFRRPLPARFVVQAAIVLGIYASIDEYLQQFVGRGSDWVDWSANLVGIGVVLWLLELRRRILARRARFDDT